MIGERENITNDTEYGTLVMRPYVIEGNEINAFYDASDDLIFVLDNTINSYKPNVLLVINPDGDKKWDEILSGEYDVDLEMIRPKQDNKYQKLDIEYSGLSVYENLINAYNAGDGLEEHLNQLNILRDSAARHSAMTRLNIANETITKTNATIVKTKETIVRLQERLKTLKAKLSSQKKEIGRVSTKQSAAKILKTESQIEATNEKIKRAKKRLDSAQKRLETATVDAELASELLNQPAQEIKMPVKTKPVVVEPKVAVTQAEEVEDDEELDDDFTDEDEEITEAQEEEVKPLFDTDPNIVDDDMAFKPISFEDSVEKTETVEDNEPELEDQIKELEAETPAPKLEFDPVPELPSVVPNNENATENISETYETNFDANDKPVLDSIMPVPDEDNNLQNDFKIEEQEHIDSLDQVVNMEPQKTMPAEDLIRPVPPAPQSFNAPTNVAPVRPVGDNQTESSKPTFVYYVLLFILIGLSVFTLWLYQKHMGTDKTPALTENIVAVEKTEQPKVAEPVVEKVEAAPVEEESAFIDEEPEVVPEPKVEEPVAEPEPEPEEVEEDEEPIIINAVPERVSTSGVVQEEEPEEEPAVVEVKEPVVNKPVYGASSKRDDMFVYDADEEVEDEGPQIIHQEVVMEEEVTTYPNEDDEEYEEEYAQEDEFFDEEEAAYQAEMMGYEE